MFIFTSQTTTACTPQTCCTAFSTWPGWPPFSLRFLSTNRLLYLYDVPFSSHISLIPFSLRPQPGARDRCAARRLLPDVTTDSWLPQHERMRQEPVLKWIRYVEDVLYIECRRLRIKTLNGSSLSRGLLLM